MIVTPLLLLNLAPDRGLDNSLKNFLVSVPLVADLRSPSMRDRHWQLLMEATQVCGTSTIETHFCIWPDIF